MDIKINLKENNNIDIVKLQKMAFLYNALEEGWEIKKNKDSYIFIKKHEGKKEIFLDSYLLQFMERNININNILNL
jgi:hypothetical protein